MTIIADKDRETIRDLLEKDLAEDVRLVLFTRPRSSFYVPGRQECETCDEARELLDELVGLSDKLRLEVHDLAAEPDAASRFDVPEVPLVLVRPAEPASNGKEQTNVRFLGLPAGYEFSTLLADIIDVSKNQTDLADATREAVQAIDRPIHIQVFVTPT